MPSQVTRTALLLTGALLASTAGGQATAQTWAQTNSAGAELSIGDFAGERGAANAPSLDLSLRGDGEGRFSNLDQISLARDERDAAHVRREVELEIGADHDVTGIPLDVSIAQRASFGATDEGDVTRHARGSEVRIGRALGDPDSGMTTSQSRIYVFAASDNEALQWRPGQDNSLSLQRDTVQVGDRQAGVTYQSGPLQASIAYVEREISAQVGRHSHSDNEQFAGFTLTMKN